MQDLIEFIKPADIITAAVIAASNIAKNTGEFCEMLPTMISAVDAHARQYVAGLQAQQQEQIEEVKAKAKKIGKGKLSVPLPAN